MKWPLILLLSLTLLACTPQTADNDAYRDEAHVAVGAALSEVASTALVHRARSDGQVWEFYAVTTVRASEKTVATAADGFSACSRRTAWTTLRAALRSPFSGAGAGDRRADSGDALPDRRLHQPAG